MNFGLTCQFETNSLFYQISWVNSIYLGIRADIINYKSVLKLNQLAISVGYLLCANGNVVFVS